MNSDEMSVVAFLRARLDEDERNAKQQPTEWAKDWAKFLVDPIIGPFGGQSRLRNVATGFYVAAQSDPRHVLAEVAAKRAIIAAFELREEQGYADHGEVFGYHATGLLVAIRHLAAVYADHPDYRQVGAMNFRELPKLGSRELMEHRARAVLVDADLWRNRPTDLNASMLRDSVDQWRHARDAYYTLTLSVQDEMAKEAR